MRTDYMVTNYMVATHTHATESETPPYSAQLIKDGWQPWGQPFTQNDVRKQAWVKYDYQTRLQSDNSNHY